MGAFFMLKLTAELSSDNELLALSSLMACACQKFSVFMLSHFFSSLFYNAAQQITSNHGFLYIKRVILHDLFLLSIFFFTSHLQISSNDQLPCCESLQNAHIPPCMLRFFIGSRLVLERNLYF